MRVCDLHNDLLTSDRGAEEAYVRSVLEGYSANGVQSLVLAIWTTGMKSCSLSKIKGMVCPFLHSVDIDIKPAIEDISCLNDYEIMSLDTLNPAYVSLTWNYPNALAGGAYSSQGVTERGRSVIEMLYRQNIVIDTAHLNAPSFYELADTPDIRIINSHTAFAAVREHPRNITHDQARVIVMRGGIVGLAAVGDFLVKDGVQAQIEDLVRHIDWFVERFGCDSLALGLDYFGSDNIVKGINNYDRLGILVEKLQKMGYNNDCIENIMFKNFFNYYEVGNAVRHL